jgi:hypothetical protein
VANELSRVVTSAGYSGKPLGVKLGIAPGKRLATGAAPEQFATLVSPLPAGTKIADVARSKSDAVFDIIVLFVRGESELCARLPKAEQRLDPDGALWVAWPKKTSGMRTDMTEDRVRAVALPRGLVDNKVCAIDETWSGLRLVWRKELRANTKSKRNLVK